jgi:hypothetical protein
VSSDITKYSGPTRWKPGQSGNPTGPKPGYRKMFSDSFFKDLQEVWADEGKKAMLLTAQKQPSTFLALAARLIPQQVEATLQAAVPGNLSPSDWVDLRELLSAVQKALPDASNRPPGEIFRYVTAALDSATWTIEAGKNKA